MKKIFILLLISLFINCKTESDASEENVKVSLLYYIVYLDQFNRNLVTVCAYSGGTPIQTNIKSIDVYKNNIFSFSQKISEFNTAINFSCYPNHYIQFDPGTSNMRYILIKNCTNEDCEIEIYLRGEGVVTYKTKFNGDFNTFTEIIAGEYKFVPVR